MESVNRKCLLLEILIAPFARENLDIIVAKPLALGNHLCGV